VGLISFLKKKFYLLIDVSIAALGFLLVIVLYEAGGNLLLGEWTQLTLVMYVVNEILVGSSSFNLIKKGGGGDINNVFRRYFSLKIALMVLVILGLVFWQVYSFDELIVIVFFSVIIESFLAYFSVYYRIKSDRFKYVFVMLFPKFLFILFIFFWGDANIKSIFLLKLISVALIGLVAFILEKKLVLGFGFTYIKIDILESVKITPHKCFKFIVGNLDLYIITFLGSKEFLGQIALIRKIASPVALLCSGLTKTLSLKQSKHAKEPSKESGKAIRDELKDGVLWICGVSILAMLGGYVYFYTKGEPSVIPIIVMLFVYCSWFAINFLGFFVINKLYFMERKGFYSLQFVILLIGGICAQIFWLLDVELYSLAVFLILFSISRTLYLLHAGRCYGFFYKS